MGRKDEHTTKESFFGFDSWYKTKARDPKTGKEGTGRDYDKGKSIKKARKDLHERRR